MAASIEKAVEAAYREWEHWGKSRWNLIKGTSSTGFHTDKKKTYAQYIVDTYFPPQKPQFSTPSVDAIMQDKWAWSAITVSYFMLQGGFTKKGTLPRSPVPTDAQFAAWVAATAKGEFPVSIAHADYLRWAIRARKSAVTAASYWGYRVDEAAATPDVGDIIGCPRVPKGTKLTHDQVLKYFDRTSSYDSHADLVVARRPGEIDVIGGNVRQSVTLKTLALASDGRIADTSHYWFVVMKYRP